MEEDDEEDEDDVSREHEEIVRDMVEVFFWTSAMFQVSPMNVDEPSKMETLVALDPSQRECPASLSDWMSSSHEEKLRSGDDTCEKIGQPDCTLCG